MGGSGFDPFVELGRSFQAVGLGLGLERCPQVIAATGGRADETIDGIKAAADLATCSPLVEGLEGTVGSLFDRLPRLGESPQAATRSNRNVLRLRPPPPVHEIACPVTLVTWDTLIWGRW
jgi:hypothetical protein